jgi:hypothetical protein
MDDAISRACATAALAAGREIRALVHAMDPRERAEPRRPLLKPHGGYGARHVDCTAEAVGLAHLERLARTLDCALELLVDPAAGITHRIGRVPDLIPSVALVAGAGGVSVDFAGRALHGRTLAAGRTSVLHAANDEIARRVLALVATAHARTGVSP